MITVERVRNNPYIVEDGVSEAYYKSEQVYVKEYLGEIAIYGPNQKVLYKAPADQWTPNTIAEIANLIR